MLRALPGAGESDPAEIEALKAAHAGHAKEVYSMKAATVHHASVEERLNFLEQMLGDSVDKHGKELAAGPGWCRLCARTRFCPSAALAFASPLHH